ncbi:ABC transporter ATP-binding protein [Metabacillus sp. RGM 3146]|uniref:ABC transporter ATP-binding protein n=1 Tax=Metabacillus sp. RGM 3146 TaxID=3401092 RepID=UPI003B9C76D5
MIQLQNVTKIYSNGKTSCPALDKVSFEIGKGEFIGIIGKSGSGKSTLLNILSGVDHPSAGSVEINGTLVSALSSKKLTKWRAANIGIVFQAFHLIPTLTLMENVMLPMEFNKKGSRKKRRLRAAELLESVGLAERMNHFPDHVSGGEKQRAAIARSLANDPPIIMADEPTGNLDSENAFHIFSLFESLVDEGKTVIIVTHDQDLAIRADRTLQVKDGRIMNPLSRERELS